MESTIQEAVREQGGGEIYAYANANPGPAPPPPPMPPAPPPQQFLPPAAPMLPVAYPSPAAAPPQVTCPTAEQAVAFPPPLPQPAVAFQPPPQPQVPQPPPLMSIDTGAGAAGAPFNPTATGGGEASWSNAGQGKTRNLAPSPWCVRDRGGGARLLANNIIRLPRASGPPSATAEGGPDANYGWFINRRSREERSRSRRFDGSGNRSGNAAKGPERGQHS